MRLMATGEAAAQSADRLYTRPCKSTSSPRRDRRCICGINDFGNQRRREPPAGGGARAASIGLESVSYICGAPPQLGAGGFDTVRHTSSRIVSSADESLECVDSSCTGVGPMILSYIVSGYRLGTLTTLSLRRCEQPTTLHR